MKNITTYLVPAAIIIAGLAIAGGLYQIGKKDIPGALSPDGAAEKAIDFINNVALQGQATASLLEIVEESGLYKIRIKIEGEEYESYITKDAKLLFPQGTKISEEISDNTSASQELPKTDVPQVELFVMSFCPYGNQAEELMMPIVELLGEKANIESRYIVSQSPEGKFSSLHGAGELNQDVREFCVQKYQKDKFLNFVKEVNNSCTFQNVDSCWEGIAKKVGVDVGKVKICQKNESSDILTQEVAVNKKYGIQSSPTLIINEKEYQGSRSSEAYKNSICSAFNSAPDECSQTLSSQGSAASGKCE